MNHKEFFEPKNIIFEFCSQLQQLTNKNTTEKYTCYIHHARSCKNNKKEMDIIEKTILENSVL